MKKTISYKVSPETHERLKASFNLDADAETNFSMLLDVFEQYANERQINLSDYVPIQEFEEMNLKLQNSIKQLKEQEQKNTLLACELAEQKLLPDTNGEINIKPSPLASALLNRTAELLSTNEKSVTKEMILIDMFLRYTIERYCEWFYPFCLSKSEILKIAQDLNIEVTEFAQLKKLIKQ